MFKVQQSGDWLKIKLKIKYLQQNIFSIKYSEV